MRKRLIPAAIGIGLLLATGSYILTNHFRSAPQTRHSSVTLTAVPYSVPADAVLPTLAQAQAGRLPDGWGPPQTPQSLVLDPAPARLAVQKTAAGGWAITASPDPASQVMIGPTSIGWTENQQALITWEWDGTRADLLLLDLKSGQLSTVRDAQGFNLSPDGRPVSSGRASGPEWAVGLQNDAVCYQAATSTAVLCFDPHTSSNTVLLGPDGHSPRLSHPVTNPSGRYLAFTYQQVYRPTPDPNDHCPPFAQCKPSQLLEWQDALLLYDSQTHRIQRLALPVTVRTGSAVWSSDGAYLGFAVYPQCDGCPSEYWSLNVATNRLNRMPVVVDAKHPSPGDLWQVEPDGALLLADTRSNPSRIERLAYGQPPEPWPPDRTFLRLHRPQPKNYSLPADLYPEWQVVSTTESTFTLYPPNGQSCTFSRPPDLPAITPGSYLQADSTCQWAALQTEKGQVSFVHR